MSSGTEKVLEILIILIKEIRSLIQVVAGIKEKGLMPRGLPLVADYNK